VSFLVDGPVASYFHLLMDLTAVLVLRFATIVIMSPAYTVPSSIIGVLGGWIGQLYIKSQLAVKREMSNARAPVLGHFGAAVAGLGNLRSLYQWSNLIVVFLSFGQGVRCTSCFPSRVQKADQSMDSGRTRVL
jgi:hypothetical protein